MATAHIRAREMSDTAGRRSSRPGPPALRHTASGAAVLMGLIAGFFYAYACSVMVGLARVDDRTFIETMQAINATVRNAAFAPSFFGSLLVTAAAAAMAHRSRSAARPWIFTALVLYAGAFLITMGISVPLNDQLAAAGAVDEITDLAAVRARYEGPWVLWNIVRTVLATAALSALIGAIARLRAPAPTPTSAPR